MKGEAAKRVLAKLVRVQTGNLNEEDKKEIKAIEQRKREAKWNITWEI
ncbi:hypothetical protein [Prevotella communis]|nr:hypothetical protein [Prevotella communis]UKK56936.1 hypothetical protein L6476_01370 [Prevotella communis]